MYNQTVRMFQWAIVTNMRFSNIRPGHPGDEAFLASEAHIGRGGRGHVADLGPAAPELHASGAMRRRSVAVAILAQPVPALSASFVARHVAQALQAAARSIWGARVAARRRGAEGPPCPFHCVGLPSRLLGQASGSGGSVLPSTRTSQALIVRLLCASHAAPSSVGAAAMRGSEPVPSGGLACLQGYRLLRRLVRDLLHVAVGD